MTMLKQEGFELSRSQKALAMLLIDRKNEFRVLAEAVLWSVPTSMRPIKNQEEFLLNFCLDVCNAFKTWSGAKPLGANSDMKALTILRQLSHNKKTMTELCHLLNLAYTLAEEFKVVYKRIA